MKCWNYIIEPITLMLGLVPCLASITVLVIDKNQVGLEHSLYFIKLFTFVYFIVFTMAALSNTMNPYSRTEITIGSDLNSSTANA